METTTRVTADQKRFQRLLRERMASRGRVFIIEDRCKGCGYCIEYCPTGVLVRSDKFNVKGYHPPVLVENPPDKVCIGCRFCELVCPEFAIYVEVLK